MTKLLDLMPFKNTSIYQYTSKDVFFVHLIKNKSLYVA